MPRMKVRKDCLYCGDSGAGKLTKEHLFQATIGGVRKFLGVCEKCNNGVLSELDRELCVQSPLSLIAGPVIHEGIGWTWDIDDSENGLLLEGRGDPGGGSMTQWPQIVFDTEGPQLHADHLSMAMYGIERTIHTFVKHMRHAVARFKRTHKGVVFRKFPYSESLARQYRYPPRIYVEHQPSEFSDDMTFIVGHITDNDRRRVLHAIDQWDPNQQFRCREIRLGSEVPVVRNRWDHVRIVRALTKIGLNLLFDTAKHTDVGVKTFTAATSFVLTGRGPNPSFLASCGFVWPEDLVFLKHADGGHAFRLIHQRNVWHVMLSFFGGRVAAFVRFPGPNAEHWQCVEGHTPLKSQSRDVSKDWKLTFPKFVFNPRLHIELSNPHRIIPSLDLHNVHQTREVPIAT